MKTRKSVEANSVLKRCIFEGCNSDSRYSTISFFSFPKPCLRVRNNFLKPVRRHIDSCYSCHTCQRWIDLCLRKDGKIAPGIDSIGKNAYICSSHFVDRQPSATFPEPLPVAQVLKIRTSQTKRVDREEQHNKEIPKKRPKTTGAERSNKTKKIDEEEHHHQVISEKRSAVTKGVEVSSEKENNPKTTRPKAVDDSHSTNLPCDLIDLNEFILSTSKHLQQMCDELQISSILNKDLSYVNASKERITLTTPVEDGGQSLEILIVNKEPTDTSPALIETASELENMVKQMENMLSANDVNELDHKQVATDDTNPIAAFLNQQIARLQNDKAQLKNQVAFLQNKVSELQRQLQIEREGKNKHLNT